MNFSIAIAVQDKGGIRSNTGDIIAVRPAGWVWGTEELKRFLILELDIAIAIDGSRVRKLEVPHFVDGARWWKGHDINGFPIEQPIVSKRRYCITQARLDAIATANGITLDWNRIRDINDEYQPLRNISISPLTNLRDKFKNDTLTLQDLIDIRDA